MSALYPLRMNSKYQSEIEQLETMGFDGNEAAQFLEENDGNVVRTVEQLLQNEPNDSDDESESEEEEEYNQQNGEQNGEEELETEIIENDSDNNNNDNNNSIIYDLNQIVDEMMKDFGTFCGELPVNIVCSKLMIFIWCVIIVIIPIVISLHNGECKHNINHNKSNTNVLKNGYIYLLNNNGQYLSLDLFERPKLTTNKNFKSAIWKLEIDNNSNSIKLKNTQTDKYLRVNDYFNNFSCDEKDGIWTQFNIYKSDGYRVTLQSASRTAYYLSHTRRWWDTRTCKYPPSRYCVHASHSPRNYRSQWIVKYVEYNDVVQENENIVRDFETIYDFEDDVLFNNDDVIIKHMYHYDSYMQLKTVFNNDIIAKNEIKSNGGIWNIERIENDENDRILVKLKNKLNKKYLRIVDNTVLQVNIGGTGGKYTLFEATLIEAQNHNLKAVRLESVQFPGSYIVIRSGGEINVTGNCDGDIDCVLIFLTTKRSKDLINLKNEIKIVELEQEIENLKKKKCSAYYTTISQPMIHVVDGFGHFEDLDLDDFDDEV